MFFNMSGMYSDISSNIDIRTDARSYTGSAIIVLHPPLTVVAWPDLTSVPAFSNILSDIHSFVAGA